MSPVWTVQSNGSFCLSSILLANLFVFQRLHRISRRSRRRSRSSTECQRLQRFKKRKICFFSESTQIFLLDEKKFQEISKENPSENDEDLPRIDLNEMLADMTVEDNNEMDS